MEKPLNVYFAGGLFDHKQLAGNQLLAKSIHKNSDGKYVCCLPQDFESENEGKPRADQIRDGDIWDVMTKDVAIFNFDGTELDSGTVVEFMIAKMLDIPSVCLRTDFRNGGDQETAPWNLMCSFYPRTENLIINSMALYCESKRDTSEMVSKIADKVIEKLNIVMEQDSLLNGKENIKHVYQNVLRHVGGNVNELFSKEYFNEAISSSNMSDHFESLVSSKIEKGVYKVSY